MLGHVQTQTGTITSLERVAKMAVTTSAVPTESQAAGARSTLGLDSLLEVIHRVSMFLHETREK